MLSLERLGMLYGKNNSMPFTSGISLRTNLFITYEDHIFVANLAVIDPTWNTMTMNVISQPIGAVMEFSTKAKIRKYWRLHEGHHFILMAMEMHGAPRLDMDCFIKECVHLFHDRWSRGHLSLSFYIQFFGQCVSIVLYCAFVFVIERKITLVRDVCFRFLITFRSHNLYVGDIKGVVGEITSYHEKD